MSKRKIINIDADKCTGCGLCIPNCPEGALQMIDGKARLIGDLFCDGLGACIGHCPEGAITIEEREAEKYDGRKVMENIVKQGKNVIKAHLEHLKEHGETSYLNEALDVLKEKGIENPLPDKPLHGGKMPCGCPPTPEKNIKEAELRRTIHRSKATSNFSRGEGGCPGTNIVDLRKEKKKKAENSGVTESESQLSQWPVQIKLVPPFAPYLKNADLLIAADCVPFAYAAFHDVLLKGRAVLVGCPKLDDSEFYKEKIASILKENDIKSITCAHMEVPCCFGLVGVVQSAIQASGKNIPLEEVTISIKGEKVG